MTTYALVHASTDISGGAIFRTPCRTYTRDTDCFHAFSWPRPECLVTTQTILPAI